LIGLLKQHKAYFVYFLIICLGSMVRLYAQIPTPIEEEQEILDADSIDFDRTNVEFLITEGMHFLAIENGAKALDSFLKALKVMPDNAAVNNKVGEIYFEDKELDKAMFYAKRASETDPTNYFYSALLANIYTEQGDLKSAIDTFESLYENDAEAPDDYLLELAALYIYNQEPKNALETYDRIESRLGILEQVSVQKQKIYLQLNDLKGAVKEGDKLSKAYPSVAAYAISLAQMYEANDKEEMAINYLEAYLKEQPYQALAHLSLAELLFRNQNSTEAVLHLKQAFESEEISLQDKLNNFIPLINTISDQELLVSLGDVLIKLHPTEANAYAANGDMFFSFGKKDSALHYYRKAVSYNASNLQLWQNILNLELEEQNYQQVAKYAEEALTYFPNQPVMYLYAGSGYFSLKKYSRAITAWKQGVSIVFDNDKLKSTFWGQIADAYHAEGNNEEAFDAYEKAISFNSKNYFAVNNYTYYLSLEKIKLERAEKLARTMVADNPENATFLDTYGWVLFQMGNFEKAREVLARAVKFSESGTIIEHYGDALFKVGAIDKAVEQWKIAEQKTGASKLLSKKINDKSYYE
jgi:tetratricopeptide (TPR) repeat protein